MMRRLARFSSLVVASAFLVAPSNATAQPQRGHPLITLYEGSAHEGETQVVAFEEYELPGRPE